MSFKTPF